MGNECNSLLPQDLCCTQGSTLAVVDRGQQLTQVVGTYPPMVEEDYLIPQPEVVEEELLGAGNCLLSLLMNRSQPSVGSADSDQNSADLRWTLGSSRDLKCNTGEVEECNACDTLMGVVSNKICGENMREEDSLLKLSNRDLDCDNVYDAVEGTEG